MKDVIHIFVESRLATNKSCWKLQQAHLSSPWRRGRELYIGHRLEP